MCLPSSPQFPFLMTIKLTATSRNQGKRIEQVGVAVQLLCFGVFTVIAIRFNFIAKRFTEDFESRISNTDSHEWCIYVFDALPIFTIVAMYIYWHPGKYLPHLDLR